MLDLYGPLHGLSLAAWLWLVPGLPLIGALLAGYIGLTALPREREVAAARQLLAWRAGVGLSAAALALIRWGHDLQQLQHLARIFRVGRIELSADLLLDPVSLLTASSVLLASGALSFGRAGAARPRDSVLIPLATSGALVAALADAVPIAVLGGLVASLSGAIVASAHLRAFCIHRFSDALLLLGAATLAWALGGGFGAGEFTSDMSPRIAIESGSHDDARATAARSLPMDDDDDDDGPRRPASAGPKPLDLTGGGKASLTIAALPGSLIFLDESKTPLLSAEKIPVRTPVVRLSIPAGLHVVRLRPPGAGEDSLLSHVVATTGQDVRIIAVGPTTSLRETAEQLAASWLQGDRPLRTDLLSHEAWPGTRLSTLAALAIALGALLRLVSLAYSVRDFVGVSALISLPMLTLLTRLSPLLTVEPAVAGMVAAAAALCALVLAARAATASDGHGALVGVAASKAALSVVGVLAGAPGAALLDAGITLVAIVALEQALATTTGGPLLAANASKNAPSGWNRVFVFATLAITASAPIATELVAALGFSGAKAVPGVALLGASLSAVALGAFGLARVHAMSFATRSKDQPATTPVKAWIAAAASLIGAACLLGFDARAIGSDASLASRVVGHALDAGPANDLQSSVAPVTLLWLGLTLGALALARSRYTQAGVAGRSERSDASMGAAWAIAKPAALADLALVHAEALLARLTSKVSDDQPPAERSRGRLVWGLVVVGALPVVAIIASWVER